MIGKSVHELSIGDAAEFTKTISESDVYVYAGVTGDLNPVHVDEVYSQKTFFKTRIAQGMLLAGFISGILGNQLPGPGTIYVKQDLRFLAPVPIGDTITARVEVTDIDVEENRLVLKTTCVNQDGRIVLEGRAEVMPPKKSEMRLVDRASQLPSIMASDLS